MQPINIFNSQDVKVTIDENGTPVNVYLTAGLSNSLLFYPTYSALPSPGQGGLFYITEDTNYIYRWDGAYIQVGGGSLTWGQITGTLSNQTDLQTALDDKVPYTGATGNIDIGVYNVIANDGTSDSAFAPNFVGVENASGYTVIDPQGLYAVDGSGQMEVNAQGLIFPNGSIQTTAGISGVDWGDIQGALTNQTDLQTALDGKVDENSAITGDTKTKITYDSKGLVTSGADAVISDITGLQTALDGKVPYTGATGNVDLGEYGLRGGYYQFDTTPTEYTQAVGNVGWNDTEGTIETLLKGGNVVLEIGQKLVARVVNGTGGNVLKSNYQVVKVTGAQGQRLQVNLAQANNDANSADTLGLIAENISNNQAGFIITSGIIDEVNTTGSLQSETWADGDPLYLSPTTAGKITNVKPQAPNHTVIIGFVVYAHANHGKIFVKIDNGYELDELHNVKINTPLNGQVLRYNGTLFVWENSNDSDNLTFNSPLSRSVNAISISQSSASSNGYLSSTDWSTFNGKQNALTNPVTGTGTSNELAYFSGTSAISSLTTATYPSLTELSYVKGVTSSIQTQLNGKQATLTNPVTGTGTNGQVAYWNGTTSQTGSATFTFSPTAQLLVNNSITASSAIARGVNLTPTLTAAANSDVLVGLDINPTFTNGAFTGVSNYALRVQDNLLVSKNQNGLTGVIISNTTSGTSSYSYLRIQSDVSSGLFDIGKSSNTTNAYKIISSRDAYFFNAGTGGDISILNDLPSGKIKLAAGGSSTAQATLFSTGNLAIGTTTDSGYKLDVNGTVRTQADLTISDTKNIILSGTTGTKIGTATSQKLSFWNATPIVQPTTGVAAATLVGGGGTTLTDTDTFDGYTLKQIVKALRNTGILA